MSIVACSFASGILQFHLVLVMRLVDRLHLHKAVGSQSKRSLSTSKQGHFKILSIYRAPKILRN